MIGCIYIVVCDLNMKITGIALFGCSLGFSDFFLLFILSDLQKARGRFGLGSARWVLVRSKPERPKPAQAR